MSKTTPLYIELELTDELRDLMAEVGIALNRWSMIEQVLVGVFRACFNPIDGVVATLCFNAIVSTDGRLAMLDAVLIEQNPKSGDGEDLGPIWGKLKSRIIGQKSPRNKLAHFGLVKFSTETESGGVAIVPFLYAWPRKWPDELKPMLRDEIMEHSAFWVDLRHSLLWFLGELQEFRGQPREYHGPPTDLIEEIRAQLAQNPKGPASPPLSSGA